MAPCSLQSVRLTRLFPLDQSLRIPNCDDPPVLFSNETCIPLGDVSPPHFHLPLQTSQCIAGTGSPSGSHVSAHWCQHNTIAPGLERVCGSGLLKHHTFTCTRYPMISAALRDMCTTAGGVLPGGIANQVGGWGRATAIVQSWVATARMTAVPAVSLPHPLAPHASSAR